MERERREGSRSAGPRESRSAGIRELRRRQVIRRRLIVCCLMGLFVFVAGIGAGWLLRGLTIRKPVDLSAIEAPAWIDQQFISVNPYSRPGTKLAAVNGIVIHYVGNPGSAGPWFRDSPHSESQSR